MGPGSISKNRAALIIALILAVLTLSTLFTRAVPFPAYQWLISALLLAAAACVFHFLKGGLEKSPGALNAVILLTFIIVSAVAFHKTAANVFRSDYWLILGVFNKAGGLSFKALKDISLFEMFGDVRFQPLAHLLLYIRHLLFGNHVLLYHMLNILLHALTGFAVFLLLKRVIGSVWGNVRGDVRGDALWGVRFSYALGLIFIVLPSQFDTVVWTYHIYVMLGALLVLLSVISSLKFAESGRGIHLVLPFLLAGLSVLLYEPAIFVPAALSFIMVFTRKQNAGRIEKKTLVRILVCAAVTYAVYASFTLYGLSLKEGAGTSHGEMALLEHALLSLKAFFKNLLESTFIKNIGVLPSFEVDDLVYVVIHKENILNAVSAVKVISALFLLTLLRVEKKNRLLLLTLAAVALSYIGIISVGRVLTNYYPYVPAQPRYQYLPNAMLLVAAGAALWPKYGKKRLRPVINVLLAAIFFWNTQNVLYGNGVVAEAMKPVDTHYYRLKGFFKVNPDSSVFLSFVPSNRRLFLGSDISMDYLFKGRTTRFIERATHVYDGYTVAKNPFFNPEEAGRDMGDFSISWMHMYPAKGYLIKDISLVGSKQNLPMISVTKEESVRVELSNAATGQVEALSFPIPRLTGPGFDGWYRISVEKQGGLVCLYLDDRPIGVEAAPGRFGQWRLDGADLLGGYYSGSGEVFFVYNIFIQIGLSRLGCGGY